MKETRKKGFGILLAIIMLASVMSTGAEGLPDLTKTGSGGPPPNIEVKAGFKGSPHTIRNHLLKLTLPDAWSTSKKEEGALLTAWDPDSLNSLKIEELRGEGIRPEDLLAAFSADPNVRDAQEVFINGMPFVHYVSPGSDLRGFVSETGYSDRVLLFKFEPASEPKFTELDLEIMSTLTRMGKTQMKPKAEVTPAPEPYRGILTWQMLLDAAKAGSTRVLIGADLHRGKLATAVFRTAVTIKSINGNLYVLDGNGKQAIRVEKPDGTAVSGLSEITGLKFINGDAGAESGGAVYVNGDLLVTDSVFINNTAKSGGAIALTGDLSLVNTQVSGNSADLYGGGIYSSDGDIVIRNSTLSENDSAHTGGGIHTVSGDITINDSILSYNTSDAFGGAVISSIGAITLTGTSLLDNSTGDLGGGIFTFSGDVTIKDGVLSGNTAANGGAVFSQEGDVLVMESALISNTAAEWGGGIYAQTGEVV